MRREYICLYRSRISACILQNSSFIGHIHKSGEDNKSTSQALRVELDITETGKRRILIFDTDKKSVESVR